MSSAIELRGVVKSFGAQRVLDGLDLTVPRGAITVLTGPSGVGKTTTVKLILGLLVPEAGDVLVEGRAVTHMSDAELLRTRQRFGVMLQGFQSLYESSTLRENIGDGADHWLAAVGLAGRGDALPSELSVGMRKRAGLAKALAAEREIVILDDFEGGLDDVRLNLLIVAVRQHQQRSGATMLVTTHKDAVIDGLGDVVVSLAEVGDPTAVVEPVRRTRLERWHIVALACVIAVLVVLIVLQIVDQAEDGGRLLVPA